MFAHAKRGPIVLALLASLAIAIPVVYFSEGRSASTSLNPSSRRNQPKAPKRTDASAPRKSGWTDTDEDGVPDALELTSSSDRENFRSWFTNVAEMQFYRLSDQWNSDQRDCSGLVRFAWREALRRHDHAWFKRMGPEYEQVAPDVSSYNLEQALLGEKLFRTDAGGPFAESDLTSARFSDFADARTLKTFNARFVSRDRGEAEPGDLLFFHQPWVQKFSFHVMIYLGRANIADDGNSDWVVYHTGASATDQGAVKKVRLAILDQHPNKRWRPVQSNQNFLGFYRLKILE
jgi:uncharacterized protein YfaT (DUF1175 family)